MKFDCLSRTGPKGENQDAVLPPFASGGAIWCAIADGVGSAAFGGLAARASIDIVKTVTGDAPMAEVFSAVSKNLSTIAAGLPSEKAVSTTLSVLRISGNHAVVGHVGDTRISHYRGAGVLGRTIDQTEVQKLVDDGVLTKNQARRYPRRNVLLSAMSAGRSYDLFQTEFAVTNGDRILLTTDGFHTKLLRRKIAELSVANPKFSDFWDALVLALAHEELSDDASCLAIEIE